MYSSSALGWSRYQANAPSTDFTQPALPVGKAGAGRGDGGRACVSQARAQSWLHAVGIFLHPRGISGMGQGTHVTHLGTGISCCAPSHSVCSLFCAQKSRWQGQGGGCGTLAEQKGDKISATKSFPCTAPVPQHSPPGRTLEAGESHMKVFPCAFALEAATKSLSHIQKSQMFRSAGMVQHPAMLHWSCQGYP